MISIFEQIFSGNPIITIMIQFPKSTIQDIKMFIGEIACDLVDIFFFIHELKGFEEVGATDLTRGNATGMTLVDGIENAGNDRHGVLFLEFGVIGKEFEALLCDRVEYKTNRERKRRVSHVICNTHSIPSHNTTTT
jgi:hypothetical protein